MMPQIEVQSPRARREVECWLVNEVANLVKRPHSEIRLDQSMFEFGLDSSAAIGLTDLLADWLDREVDPTWLYDHPTIEGFSKALVARGAAQ